jgi:hypothetical protein
MTKAKSTNYSEYATIMARYLKFNNDRTISAAADYIDDSKLTQQIVAQLSSQRKD